MLIGVGHGARLIGSTCTPQPAAARVLTPQPHPHRSSPSRPTRSAERLLSGCASRSARTPVVVRGDQRAAQPLQTPSSRGARHLRGNRRQRAALTTRSSRAAGRRAPRSTARGGARHALIDLGPPPGTRRDEFAHRELPRASRRASRAPRLAERAGGQAARFGVHTPCRRRRSRAHGRKLTRRRDRGRRAAARPHVVVLTGAAFRRCRSRACRVQGAGVYYAATQVEAQRVPQRPGRRGGGAGNSAGQAAVLPVRSTPIACTCSCVARASERDHVAPNLIGTGRRTPGQSTCDAQQRSASSRERLAASAPPP